MKRLTTDKPEGNVENLLNLFYIKDQWTWVRGYGSANGDEDISLSDLVRMMTKAIVPDAELPKSDDDLSFVMPEWLMFEPDSPEGIIALLYNAGWAFAELRQRLAYYEDLKEQGRLVELPCKIDTPIYLIRTEKEPRKGEKYIVEEYDIDHFTIGGAMIPMITACSKENEWKALIDGTQRGHEYFFDREEAEKALAEVRDHA